MRQVSASLAAAIESSERTPRIRLSVDWDGDGHGPQPAGPSHTVLTPFLGDTFQRTVSNGVGAPDQGQPWQLVGNPSDFSAIGTAGRVASNSLNNWNRVLAPVNVQDVDMTVELDPRGNTPTGVNANIEQALVIRYIDGLNFVDFRTFRGSGGTVTCNVRQVVNLVEYFYPGFPTVPGTVVTDHIMSRILAVGNRLLCWAWKAGTTMPAAPIIQLYVPMVTTGQVGVSQLLETSITNAFPVAMGIYSVSASLVDTVAGTPAVDGSLDDLSTRASAVTVTSVLQTTLPDQVAAVEGTAAATFSADLAGGSDRLAAVRYFSSFATDSPLYGKQRLNRDVEIDAEFLTVDGWQGVPILRGRSRSLPVKVTDRTAQMTGLDYRAKLRVPVSLPAMAAQVPRVGNLAPCMPGLEGSWVVSYVMWKAGFPLSPPPPDGCRLWMPMHGSAMPFITTQFQGSPVSYYEELPNDGTFPGAPIEFDTGPFVLSNRAQKDSGEIYFMAPDPAPGVAVFDGNGNSAGRFSIWMKRDNSGGMSVSILNGRLDIATFVPGATSAALQLTNNGIVVNVNCPKGTKLDGAWHFYGVDWNDRTGTATFNVDGQLYDAPFTGTGLQPGSDDNIFFEISGGQRFAELQVSTGTSAATAWPAYTYVQPATVDRSALRLDGIVPGAAIEAWAILQELATAEQGAVYLDPAPVYASRARLISTYAQVSNRTFDATPHIFDLAHDFSLDKIVNTLSADWQAISLNVQTKAYAANSTIVIPALSSLDIPISYTGMVSSQRQLLGQANTSADGTGTNLGLFGSGFSPTAQISASVLFTSDTTGTITVVNRTAKTAFLVDTAGDASLSLTGDLISQASPGVPFVIVDQSSVDAYDVQPLSMPSNRWTQSRSQAAGMAMATLGDLSQPQPVFTSLVVPGDPRLQFFDRITLTDPYNTGMALAVWVTAKTHALAAGQYDMTLSARPARNRFLAGTGLAGVDLVG